MKELNLSWAEVKSLPRIELEGLLYGLSQYSKMHQFDSMDEKDISEMAKNKPAIRSDYYRYLELKAAYNERMGVTQTKTLEGII